MKNKYYARFEFDASKAFQKSWDGGKKTLEKLCIVKKINK